MIKLCIINNLRDNADIQKSVVELYATNPSAPKIARELGIGESKVYRLLNNAGIVPRNVYHDRSWVRKFSTDQEQEMMRLYQVEKLSLSQIAKRYDCLFGTVRNILRRNDIKINPKGNRYREFFPTEVATIQQLYQGGTAQSVIAEQFHSSQSVISRILRVRGIEPRKRTATGERHGNWKGGSISIAGYRYVHLPIGHPLYSMTHRGGYVAEHRLVLAEKLGRPLLENETVHHINGNRLDNRPENLEVHTGKHGKGVIAYCLKCGSMEIGYKGSK